MANINDCISLCLFCQTISLSVPEFMLTYIVILNWNGHKDTIPCLESLLPNLNSQTAVIVCDNASTDDSINCITNWRLNNYPKIPAANLDRAAVLAGATIEDAQFILIRNEGNLGFAGGNNPGIQLALSDRDCEYIWLLNNDTLVNAQSLPNAIARMQQNPRIGICGSTLIYAHTPNAVQAFGGSSYQPYSGRSAHIGYLANPEQAPTDPAPIERQLDMIVGAAMLVSRQFVETVGLMQEDYFLYYEEIDWATRGRKQFCLGYAPASHVWHKEGASIGTSSSGGSALSVYYLYRNRLRFTLRFYPYFLPSVLFFCALDLGKLVLKRRWPQIFAALRGLLYLNPPKPKR